jgi:general secretion pathway protein D
MKRRWLRTGLLWMAVAVFIGHAWPADAASAEQSGAGDGPTARAPQTGASGANVSASPAGPDHVTLNFINADIEGVVKVVSEITGKNFVLDPRVKGTVNIVSAKPMSRALVYDVFLSALRLQGYAAIEERGIIKIVPESDAKLHQSRTLGPQDTQRAGGDRIQTQVFTLKYESAAQLVPILRPLIAPNNTIAVYQASNTLVITDYASNLQRIEKIIDSIDQPTGADPIVISLRYASALDVAQTVNRLFPDAPQAPGTAAADSTQRLTVIADTRSNSLIARSDNPARLARLRSLVAMLDTTTSVAGNIHVVYLKNAEAVKVVETLRGIYLGETAPAAQRAVTTLGPPGASATAASPGASPMTTPLGASASGAAQAASAPGIIQADAATNSIIINAPDAIYNNLRAALDKLDVRRAQVYVEALIAEITADKAAEFGIQWQDLAGAGSTNNSARVFGGTNFGTTGQNILGIAANPASAGRGLNIGVIKGLVTIPGVGQILNLNILIRALEAENNANILSTPTLLTLDNEEARIVIGQNVPFITGQYALSGAATTPTPFQTIERRDVGLTLRIKPQISEGGTVRLQIFQEVSSVQDTTNAAGVITNKRSVESTILADDGQIVVIGGLIQDTVKDGIEKVPVLGDIPILGALFQYKTRSLTKTNLMVFLRPTLVRDARAVDPLTSDRYDYILGEQRKAQPAPSAVLPDMVSPTLPPRQPEAPAEPAKPQ